MHTTDPMPPPPAPAGGRDKPKARRVLWVVGPVVLFLLFDYFFPHTLIYDDGAKDMTFQFLVVEAGSGRPVPDARIHLGDGSRGWQELRTGPDGRASTELTCSISEKIWQGFVMRTSRKSIFYPFRTVLVSKPGYREKEPLELTGLVGRWHVGDYSPPPPAKIELDPE